MATKLFLIAVVVVGLLFVGFVVLSAVNDVTSNPDVMRGIQAAQQLSAKQEDSAVLVLSMLVLALAKRWKKIVLFAVIGMLLVGCGGSNWLENVRNGFKDTFEEEYGQSRPEWVASFVAETSKIESCINVSPVSKTVGHSVGLVVMTDNNTKYHFVHTPDKPECTMSRDYLPLVAYYAKAGALKYVDQTISMADAER